MALRLKPETREAWARSHQEVWRKYLAQIDACKGVDWRPVPRSEPVAEPPKSLSRFDIYHEGWVD